MSINLSGGLYPSKRIYPRAADSIEGVVCFPQPIGTLEWEVEKQPEIEILLKTTAGKREVDAV